MKRHGPLIRTLPALVLLLLAAGLSFTQGHADQTNTQFLPYVGRWPDSPYWLDRYPPTGTEFSPIAVAPSEAPQPGVRIAGMATLGSDDQTWLYLQQMDRTGTISWRKYYRDATQEIGSPAMLSTADGGTLMLAGTTETYQNNSLLIRLDASGNVLWARRLELPYYYEFQLARLIEAPDGSLYLAGERISTWPHAQGVSGHVIKLNAGGDVLWRRSYWVNGEEKVFAAAGFADGQNDGGIVFAGISEPSLWLVRLDSEGEVLWHKAYNVDGGQLIAQSMVNTEDGGFAIAGIFEATTARAWIGRFDAGGNPLWQKLVSGGSGFTRGEGIIRQSDGSLMVAGVDYLVDRPFLLGLSSNGLLDWQAGLGNADVAIANLDLARDGEDAVLLAGKAQGGTFAARLPADVSVFPCPLFSPAHFALQPLSLWLVVAQADSSPQDAWPAVTAGLETFTTTVVPERLCPNSSQAISCIPSP